MQRGKMIVQGDPHDNPHVIEVGQVWKDKTTNRHICVMSVNAKMRCVFLSGFQGGMEIHTVDELILNCDFVGGWSRTGMML